MAASVIKFLSQSLRTVAMIVVLHSLLQEEAEAVVANLLVQDLLMILAALAECLGRRIYISMRGAKAEIHFLAGLEGAVVANANDGDL